MRLALAAFLLAVASASWAQEDGNPVDPVERPPGVTARYSCTSCAARKQRLKGGQTLRQPQSNAPVEGAVILRPRARSTPQPADSPGAEAGN